MQRLHRLITLIPIPKVLQRHKLTLTHLHGSPCRLGGIACGAAAHHAWIPATPIEGPRKSALFELPNKVVPLLLLLMHLLLPVGFQLLLTVSLLYLFGVIFEAYLLQHRSCLTLSFTRVSLEVSPEQEIINSALPLARCDALVMLKLIIHFLPHLRLLFLIRLGIFALLIIRTHNLLQFL